VYDLVVVFVAEDLFDLRGLQALDLLDFLGVIVDEPLGDQLAVRVEAEGRGRPC